MSAAGIGFQRTDTVLQTALRTFIVPSRILTIEVFMATRLNRLVLWAPRLLGVLVSVFVGVFALDAFSEGKTFAQALPDFLVHLIPAAVLLGLVAASFRRPWIGGMAFVALGVLYAVTMSRGRIDWMVTISGPLLVVGGLFLLSWFQRAKQPGS
jgi:hypothetical protein